MPGAGRRGRAVEGPQLGEGPQGLSPAALAMTRPKSLSQGLLCEDGKQRDVCLAHGEVS